MCLQAVFSLDRAGLPFLTCPRLPVSGVDEKSGPSFRLKF